MTTSTIFDVLPDPLFAYITEFSHQSLVGVSKTLSRRYVQLHKKTDPQVIGDLLVKWITKDLPWKTIERLQALSGQVFAIHLDFGARLPRAYPYCADLIHTITLFPHLREVRLCGKYISNFLVEELLGNCPDLRALSVQDSDLFTETLSTHIRCPGDAPTSDFRPFQTVLKCLRVSNCKHFNTTVMLSSLAPSLERIEITGCPISRFNNYSFSADCIRQFCDRPTTRYLKISHFFRIDTLFREIRQRHPHLILEEERVNLTHRCIYKVQDQLRSYAVPIILMGTGACIAYILQPN